MKNFLIDSVKGGEKKGRKKEKRKKKYDGIGRKKTRSFENNSRIEFSRSKDEIKWSMLNLMIGLAR